MHWPRCRSGDSMVKFQYQVLRYQPDKVAEEFMNLGVVVFDPDGGDLLMRHLDNEKRLSAFFPAVNNTYIMEMVSALGHSIIEVGVRWKRERGHDTVADLSSVTRNLLPDRDSALYFSEVRTGVDAELSQALDHLFDRVVRRYAATG